MPRSHTLMLCALLASGLAAQAPDGWSGPAQEAYAQLDAEFAEARATNRAERAAVRATEEYKKAAAARDRATTRKLLAAVEPVDSGAFARRALDLAGQFAGDDVVPFYGWVLRNGGDKALSREALTALRRDHLRSPAMAAVLESGSGIGRQLGAAVASEFFDEVIEQSPHSVARAWAIYWDAIPVTRNRRASDEDRAAAMDRLKEAAKLAEGTAAGDKIGAPVFEQERLQIGMVAPDIEGVDTDGTAFKLSDYRGKVVVLDYWGFW